jgi:hypothetical protein
LLPGFFFVDVMLHSGAPAHQPGALLWGFESVNAGVFRPLPRDFREVEKLASKLLLEIQQYY